MKFNHLACIAITALVGLPLTSSAQVLIHDTQSTATAQVPDPSVSFDVTGSTTTNSMVGVFIGLQDYGSVTLDSVTLDGVAMTEGIPLFAGSDIWGAFYYLQTQEAGANTIAVTTSGTSGNERGMTVQGVVLNDVDTSATPLMNSAALSGSGSDLLLPLSPASSGNAILGFGMFDSNLSVSSSYFASVDDALGNKAFSGQETDVSSGLQNVQFSLSGNDNAVGMSVSFAQIPEPSSAMLLLVGLSALVLGGRKARAVPRA